MVRILVLTKYSLDVTEVKVDAATHELRLAGVPEKIGNIDKNAVEAAIRLRESSGGGSVQALCLAPAAAREAFRDILAMGVDEVTLVEDPFIGQADGQTAVRVLEAAIRKLGTFDLILCGFASDDGYSYQVGPRLAERLELPLVSYVRKVSVLGDQLTADRDLDDYQQTVTAALPALLSVAEEAFPPRRTTLMDALKAKKKPVNVWTVEAELGLKPDELSQSSYVSSASQVGIVVHRKQQILKGQNQTELADQIIDLLLQENILKGGA
jgi:electron transfer flavoprotein beta subunit